ncbi:aminoglycoside phosphotransferase family protein [Rickettsia endosymbiont of Pantilius tunicatus]|uniref:aminoglycoside phosphotransferase family protein n=1 Tax=Rickettsia endosymbiont of Pantilius tunicatus TaxID=3066267 RepID=UPI00376EDAAB
MDRFRNNIISKYKEQGKAWLEKLPKIVTELAIEWNLTELKSINNLSFNYVLLGYQNNTPIILKIGFDNNELLQETEALKAFKNSGVVDILAQKDNALLLEKAAPGVSLKGYSSDNKIAIACKVMDKLHKAQIPPLNNFSNIKDQLKILDKEWGLPQLNLLYNLIY